MELTGEHKPMIISVGVGGHYAVGVNRLERSLVYHGWAGDMMFWKNDLPAGCPPHSGVNQYNFKVYAFEQAFNAGAKVVLWCDASLWAVKNPMPIFDYINEHGLYLFKSGYSLAQTATDALLYYSGESRDNLVHVSEFATGLVGINIDNPRGKEFFEKWKGYMLDGMFGGSRVNDPYDSADPRFLFSRQDQSAASMVLHKMCITTAGEDQDFQAYKNTGHNPDKLIFFIEGI